MKTSANPKDLIDHSTFLVIDSVIKIITEDSTHLGAISKHFLLKALFLFSFSFVVLKEKACCFLNIEE
jgi:hypothetical protein